MQTKPTATPSPPHFSPMSQRGKYLHFTTNTHMGGGSLSKGRSNQKTTFTFLSGALHRVLLGS